MLKGKNLYEILNVPQSASPQQLKQGYKKMCLLHHPDKNVDKVASKAKFQEVCQAYAILSDPARKQRYDKHGQTGEDIDQQQFQEFLFNMGNFKDFQDLLNNQIFNVFQGFFGAMGAKKKKKGKGRAKAKQDFIFKDLAKPKDSKKSKGKKKEEEDWQTQSDNDDDWSDQENMFKQLDDLNLMDLLVGGGQMQTLFQFIQKNTKIGKRGMMQCKLDKWSGTEQDAVEHFLQKHEKEYERWQKMRMRIK